MYRTQDLFFYFFDQTQDLSWQVVFTGSLLRCRSKFPSTWDSVAKKFPLLSVPSKPTIVQRSLFNPSRFSKKFPSKYAEVEFESVLAQGEICLASSSMVQKIPFVTRIWLFSPRRLSRVLPSFPFDFSVKPQEARIPHHSFSETFKALLMDTCNTQCNDDNQSPKSDLKLIEILKYNYHQLKQRRRGSAGTGGRQGIALDLIFKNHRCTQVLSQVSARLDPSLWYTLFRIKEIGTTFDKSWHLKISFDNIAVILN